MMRLTSSLYAKILSWFLLNLLLLVTALAIFFALQSQVNLHEFFGQQGSDRFRTAGMLIAHDLEQTSPADWPDVLARHTEIHGVDFIFILRGGIVFSSSGEKVPDTVMLKAREILERRGGPPDFFDEPCNSGDLQPQSDRYGRPHKSCVRKHHLAMHTQDPSRYWFGIGIPIFVESANRWIPSLILAASDSMTGNGFFFDPLPWMVVVGAVLLISLLFWVPLIRSITKPLVRMTRAAEEIANGNFNVSIHEPRADEIGRLANTINNMTARLSAFVKGQKRFLGDVAHELGSPVARIQFGLGVLEQRIDDTNRERVLDVMEDVDHMSKLIGELLVFSRAGMHNQAVKLERIPLLPAVQAAVKRECTASARIEVLIEPEISVFASVELLTRAVANLLRNAIKYAGEAGPIKVSAEERNNKVEISVTDQGPGVAVEHLDRLFEPFFRSEPSRDRDSGGAGLGMAIVKTCVENCGGTVSANNQQPHGFVVTIVLNC